MKAHYKSTTGRLLVEVEAKNVKELFEQLADVQEILDADSRCGACGSDQVRFAVRHVDIFKYFEMHCHGDGCGARLSFGQLREGGGLFPKRKDDRGEMLPNRGWQRYIAGQRRATHD